MISPSFDPIELQVLTGALRSACEEMGAVLIRSAHSANIKERRDASTALFDPQGQMVMQAEHIPVHLGAMPAAVRAVLSEDHSSGASWILNDPFAGGTHLPDITVITPVLAPASVRDGHGAVPAPVRDDHGAVPAPGRLTGPEVGVLLGFAVSRAHHADVGGRLPGSMAADSRTLEEEGVVISAQPLAPETIDRLAARMRQPVERRADLRAQLAANHTGAKRMVELARRIGVDRLREGTDAVLDYAERRTRTCLSAIEDGERRYEDVLEATEGDLRLCLRAIVKGDHLILDFDGTDTQHDGNLNCPLPVTHSACYFALRVLTDPDIPPSSGAYRPLTILVPEGSILNALPTPAGAPAVAAGNVETSSRVADLVLAAFGHPLGQGTMNNLTLGDDRFTYYETLGGGQGACRDGDGPSGVHVAMSNTLNTPVEALEREFPLRVTRYELRRNSGGAGVHRGGDGVVREIEALREVTYSLITDRRIHPPPGAQGGEPGAVGRNLLVIPESLDTPHDRPDDHDSDTLIGGVCSPRQPIDPHPDDPHHPVRTRELPAKTTGTLGTGERLRIETPGGGGYGPPR